MTKQSLSEKTKSRAGKRNIYFYVCLTFTAHHRHKKEDESIEIDEAKGENEKGGY